jgi:hypothetical protein
LGITGVRSVRGRGESSTDCAAVRGGAIRGMTRAAFELLFNFHLQVSIVSPGGYGVGDGDVDPSHLLLPQEQVTRAPLSAVSVRAIIADCVQATAYTGRSKTDCRLFSPSSRSRVILSVFPLSVSSQYSLGDQGHWLTLSCHQEMVDSSSRLAAPRDQSGLEFHGSRRVGATLLTYA